MWRKKQQWIYSEEYTPAIPPHWTDFPCVDTCVHAEAAPIVAGSASAFRGRQSLWQLELHLVLLLGLLLALLPGEIFQEERLEVLKCFTFLWVQRRHNCSPVASFTNCVMTIYLLKVHLQTFLSIPITEKCQIFSCDTLVANERKKRVSRVTPPTSPLAFGTKMSRTRNSTSHGTMHVKNWWKTIGTKEKSGIKSRLEKGDQSVDICCLSDWLMMLIMYDKITGSARSGRKVFV